MSPFTVLHTVVDRKCLDVVQLMLRVVPSVDPNLPMSVRGVHGLLATVTPLHFAVRNDDEPMVRLLVAHGASFSSVRGATLAWDSCLTNRAASLTMATLFAELGVRADDQSLFSALMADRPDIARLLIACGANPRALRLWALSDSAFAHVLHICGAAIVDAHTVQRIMSQAAKLRTFLVLGGDLSVVPWRFPEFVFLRLVLDRTAMAVLVVSGFDVAIFASLNLNVRLVPSLEAAQLLTVLGHRVERFTRQTVFDGGEVNSVVIAPVDAGDLTPESVEQLLCEQRKNLQTETRVHAWPQLRARMMTICVALHALELPALVVLKIVDRALPIAWAHVPRHVKWAVIVAAKHFHRID